MGRNAFENSEIRVRDWVAIHNKYLSIHHDDGYDYELDSESGVVEPGPRAIQVECEYSSVAAIIPAFFF